MIKIRKKNGEIQSFNGEKIKRAIRKSADRVCVTLTDKEERKVVDTVRKQLQFNEEAVPVSTVHNMVEVALDSVNQNVAKSYRDFRDNKSQFAAMLDKVYSKKLSLNFIGDRSNANSDSALVTTQKAIVYNELNSELYKRFFLSQKEERAVSDGYLYIHDRGSRLDTMNCFSSETEFITSEGIRKFSDFKDGDSVFVVTHKGNWKKATVHSYGIQALNKVQFRHGSDCVETVFCTENHRWFLNDGTETTSLKVGDVLLKTQMLTRDAMSSNGGQYFCHKSMSWVVDRIEQTERRETVWCLDVEDDHGFVLKHGIPTGNCCIYDMKSLITGGFFMGNLDYMEPKSLDVAFDLVADVTLNAASSQYGGFTIPQVDKLLSPYAEKSYKAYYDEYMATAGSVAKLVLDEFSDDLGKDDGNTSENATEKAEKRLAEQADRYALAKVRREFEQGFQSWEMKFNSVASSRGDYPFTAITFGLGTGRFETMCSSVVMKVRAGGQGKPGFKHPVLFPKLSFFYDKNLHGKGKELEWLYDEAIRCSMKTMYPDFISLTGDGYAPRIYKKYGVPFSRMGCRALLSPWFERGGMTPADENDRIVCDGRFNMGAISLHFSMIAAKAKKEDKDFFEVLDQYLEMARGIHRKTFEYLSHKKAGTNPLGFCQGGFYGGHKDPDEELGEDFLRPMTISFGIIGLNEASVLWTGKRIDEDNSWAVSVLEHINAYVDRIKKEDNILYAIYGTPGESLVATQVVQFKKKYGIVNGVSDRDYVTNSFHCPVYADITPIQKQDIEYPMFHLCNGGNIAYARMRSNYNFKAFKDLTDRAMEKGFYWGNNQQLDWCEKCGFSFSDSDTCPKCGSSDVTRIERMNGYLSYASVRGKTMYSDTKLQEFKERVSM